jgi:N-acetylglucosaminyldiphosphoundecaprenol N-acetyl-beta-D-mannosaminyltransferase
VSIKRIELLGVPVDCLDPETALEAVERELLLPGSPWAVIAVNPEKVIRAQRDARLRSCLHRAGLLIPDGIGVVLAARALGLGRMRRVPGCELMPAICALAARSGDGVYLFGASEAVNAQAAAVLQSRHPALRLLGRHHGFANDADMERVVASINDSAASILFLALGSPRQELWMERYLPRLTTVRVCQGVGGTFDVLAGTVRRAPPAFTRLNLEWLYRLLAQPRRLLRQSALPRFALQVLSGLIFPAARAAREPGPPGGLK